MSLLTFFEQVIDHADADEGKRGAGGQSLCDD